MPYIAQLEILPADGAYVSAILTDNPAANPGGVTALGNPSKSVRIIYACKVSQDTG